MLLQAITLRRKSRITHLESIGARNELSSLWVGRRHMGTHNPFDYERNGIFTNYR
jgi:hypothetical protein